MITTTYSNSSITVDKKNPVLLPVATVSSFFPPTSLSSPTGTSLPLLPPPSLRVKRDLKIRLTNRIPYPLWRKRTLVLSETCGYNRIHQQCAKLQHPGYAITSPLSQPSFSFISSQSSSPFPSPDRFAYVLSTRFVHGPWTPQGIISNICPGIVAFAIVQRYAKLSLTNDFHSGVQLDGFVRWEH